MTSSLHNPPAQRHYPEAASPVLTTQDQTQLSFHLTSFLLTQRQNPRRRRCCWCPSWCPRGAGLSALTRRDSRSVCVSNLLADPAETICPLWFAWMKSDLQPLWDHLSPCYVCTIREMVKHCDTHMLSVSWKPRGTQTETHCPSCLRSLNCPSWEGGRWFKHLSKLRRFILLGSDSDAVKCRLSASSNSLTTTAPKKNILKGHDQRR